MVTMSMWDEPHRGRHHYAVALSERHRVVWVNRQLDCMEHGRAKRGLEAISDNLSILHTGRSVLPLRMDEHLNVSNYMRISLLRKALTGLGIPDIMWIYDYKAMRFVIDSSSDTTLIYFCNDYFGEHAHRKYESQLSQVVDHVFVTAPKLVDRFIEFNHNCKFVPHGVWLSNTRPKFIAKKTPEVLGFVGTLGSGLDISYLRRLIEETKCRLVLAGPIVDCTSIDRKRFEQLFANDRVEYCGDLSVNEARKAISGMDIGLLPYAESQIQSRYRFALKYFDYLAAGKPMIATPYFEWPEPYSKFVGVYDGISDLAEFVTTVYSKWNITSFENAVELAENCSWQKRTREIGRYIGIDL